MSRYSAVIFDLDGTLTDPKVGITRSVRYALSQLGVQENDMEKLTSFIGAPLIDSLRKHYSFDEATAHKAVELYREYFSEHGIYQNEVFPGIPELLRALNSNKTNLLVATLKPTVFAERVLEHFGLRRHFSFVAGSNLDMTITVKADIVGAALAKAPTVGKREIAMVGDREHDVHGALKHGIDSIAVTYGYGSVEELENARPTHLVHSVKELQKLLCGRAVKQ